ncbi:hypothetical protein [Portibacter lacus]|uniref:Outer membrane protein beta-barrel domain-containing protein n=1 Tax=Portibacter lacus TaxID=1099794 RepID=A0AA37SRD8_9BACT|nr:hypothetical protein [Portibacter lacus]GLR18767.1 hypothetical protein GCM10007940_33830 [Portibacter lacus]
MKKLVIYIAMFIFSSSVFSQSDDDSSELITEFGMNMTGLVNQLVPFKQITNKTGPYAATMKFIKDKNAFRMGIGMHILSDDDFNNSGTDILNVNIRLGFERRNEVNEKFIFYQTFDLMLMAGNFNSPINDFTDTENAGAGIGLGLGIEYLIFENLSLSTEGIGFVGVVGGTSSIFNATIIPPISIFLNYKF